MGSHLDEISHVISLGEFENAGKKYMAQVWQEIKPAFCAMLNSNGGRMVIHFETKDGKHVLADGFPSSKISSVIRVLEQHVISIIGVNQTVSKIDFSYGKDNIIISIKKTDSLITANYHLYVPSQTQVLEMSPLEPLENIKNNIIYRETIPNPVELGSHCQVFFKDENCGFHESKICQFKNLKASSSKRTTLADRITCEGNKLKCYIVAFANHRGGHVCYGITDEGVVEGEFIQNEKDRVGIIKKVEKVMKKIVWPEQIGQPKRGQHWEIFFESVVGANSEPVPSTFVVVIYIAPCLGGVFTEEPECYEMVEGKVKKMSFATWKKRISQPAWLQKSPKKKNIPNSVQGITWSSGAVRKAFTIDCDELRKIVSNGNWEVFENECNSLQNESELRETMELLIKFKQITACNRTGEFKKAHELLDDYKALSLKVQDSFIFEVLGLYLEAALKRASGDFEALQGLLTEVLSKAEQIEPGLVTATVYIFAATVSDLINLESPAVLTVRALEHLKCVRDSSDVLVAMRRKANIILATFHLGCNVSGQLIKNSIDISSLQNAKTCLDAVSESAYEEHPLSVYFEIQLNLVLWIYKYRFSQLNPDQRNDYLRNACRNIEKAKSLAVKYGFVEMVEWSEKNEALCTQELVNYSDHVRNDESDQQSGERKNQPEGTGCGDCVQQCERNDHQKSTKERCYPRNSAEQVGQEERKEQENRLESKKSLKNTESQKENGGRPASTSRPRYITGKSKSQVVSSKSQNPDDLNGKKNSQVDDEKALLCADIEPTSNSVQESKGQDSSDKHEQPDSVLPLGRQKQPSTPPGLSDLSKYVDAKPFYPRNSSPCGTATHQISPSVSPVPTQQETAAYVWSNARMPMHAPGPSAFESSVPSSCHTGISPIARQRFLDSSFGFNQFPAGSFHPAYRAQIANHLASTHVACPTGLFVQNPAFIRRPASRGTRFQNGIPEQKPTRFYQRFSYTSAPAQPLQQQQMFVNQHRQFLAQNGTINRRK